MTLLSNRNTSWPAWLLAVAALSVAPARADQILLSNGDRLTGEVVQSDEEKLVLKTEFLGDVEIQWAAITEIESAQKLYVTAGDGQVLVGAVTTTGSNLEVKTAESGPVSLQKASISSVRNEEQQDAYLAEIERLRNPGLLDFWSGAIDAGLSLTRGNAETSTYTTAINVQRKTQRDKITIYETSLFARNDTTGESVTTANAIRGGSRYDVNLSEKLFTYGFVDLEFDQFQNLDLRNVLGGGFGWHLVNTERTTFDVFGGGTFMQEFFDNDITRRSAEITLGEEYRLQVSDATLFTERLVFYPNMSETGEYRIQFDSTLSTKLSNWLAWQITFSDRFITNPVMAKKNDILLSTGVRFAFGAQ